MGNGRYKGGLVLIILVLIMWVTSAEVTQGVFRKYDHPFAVTYLGTSLLVAYLPLAILKDLIRKFFRRPSSKSSNGSEPETVDTDSTSSRELDSRVHNGDLEAKPYGSPSNVKECAINICVKEEGNQSNFESKDNEETLEQEGKLSAKEVATFGFGIAPIWFLTEYLTNAALSRTSVATTTLLSSTSGLFTLLISALLGQDKIKLVKVISVVISITGVAMTTLGKTWASNQSQSKKHSLEGDVFAILSAMAYGLFTVLLKKFYGQKGERVDMQMLFGYIGLFSLVAFWWFAWPLTAMGIEPKFSFPKSAKMTQIILINGIMACIVIGDRALGVVWTSPLVAALGVSLTIPLAMVEDMFIHAQHYSLLYIIGSVQVFLGFVVANLADWISQKLEGQPSCNLSVHIS